MSQKWRAAHAKFLRVKPRKACLPKRSLRNSPARSSSLRFAGRVQAFRTEEPDAERAGRRREAGGAAIAAKSENGGDDACYARAYGENDSGDVFPSNEPYDALYLGIEKSVSLGSAQCSDQDGAGGPVEGQERDCAADASPVDDHTCRRAGNISTRAEPVWPTTGQIRP